MIHSGMRVAPRPSSWGGALVAGAGPWETWAASARYLDPNGDADPPPPSGAPGKTPRSPAPRKPDGLWFSIDARAPARTGAPAGKVVHITCSVGDVSGS